jgi:hypothetical protein
VTAIRMTRSGLNIAGASRRRGEVVDVDSDVADYLCSSGHAVRHEADAYAAVAVDDVHTAAQRTTARPGRRRPREQQ